MRLEINDFAKIKNVDIIVDGITVIAGENNTGKSTVGKILFSLFNAVSGIEDKIVKQRIREIEQSSMLIMRNHLHNDGLRRSSIRNATKKISLQISSLLDEQDDLDHSQIYCIIEKSIAPLLMDGVIDGGQELCDDLTKKIEEILALPENTIMLEILSRYFNGVFHGQINSLINQGMNATLNLNIKNKDVNLTFNSNECIKFNAEISLLHKSIYIDNPFIIDSLNSYDDLNTIDEFLRNLLISTAKDDIMAGIIETVLAKEKLSEIYKALQSIVDGQIIIKNDDEFYLEKEGFAQPISFNNLSTGLKSFVIIKMLVEKGIIKEKDILILDEPEIHLHPQWQIAYAELVVLLQKYFDLSIVVTTHSPYFLDAINLFSIKHGVNDKVNYYISSMENNSVTMSCVNGNIDLIYQKMASPIQMLDSLRYELSEK